MTILPNFLIRELALQHKMIDPFVDHCYDRGTISYGLSSYGYDARLADEFRIFTSLNGQIVDPKCFASSCFVQHKGDHCIIPPNSFALGRTVERFKIPRDCLVICLGKSTYARCGIVVNVTPLEPEWEGYVTIEISNTTPLPAKIYAGEGICQFIFLKADSPCEVSYADKKGKYQDQKGIVGPIVMSRKDDGDLAQASFVLISDGRRVIAHKRKKDGSWGLPGGKLDVGETPLGAAVRELREEYGIEVDEDALGYLGVVRHDGMNLHLFSLHIENASDLEDIYINMEPSLDEVCEVSLFSIETLKSLNINPGLAKQLESLVSIKN